MIDQALLQKMSGAELQSYASRLRQDIENGQRELRKVKAVIKGRKNAT